MSEITNKKKNRNDVDDLFLAHTFLPSLDNADGRLCKERLLRSRNFASMVMWRHTSLLYYIQEGNANKTRVREDGTEEEEN